VERNKEGDGFVRLRLRATKEQDAVGGARLTIEIGAEFPIGIKQGLNCSPFEAEAVLDVVKEVYFPFLSAEAAEPSPGKISLVAVAADEPAGKPVANCKKQTVCLTLHRGKIDDLLFQQHGPAGFRQARILDLCQQALSQGALLTSEDLAYRIFFVTPRTISRDLILVRKAHPNVLIPMRSTLHDLGPVLTHRIQIIRLALQGKTTTQICQIMHHSPEAVANYLSTFTRCVQLARKEMQAGQIAFLLRRGISLIKAYLDILEECQRDRNMDYHLDELLRIGSCGGEKKIARGRSTHE
jgi:DNA-binding CsgD family transcriptional regulator